jgi:dTMP kinase
MIWVRKYSIGSMIKNSFRGKFIVLEGLDGAGKSTQVPLILDYFSAGGEKSLATAEPSELPVGRLLRQRLLGEWDCGNEPLQLLFAADRADHLAKEILPALARGENVISDRYFLSSLVYGAVDSDMKWLTQVNARFLAPDLTIYLDVPPSVCARRIAANGKSMELFEKIDILEKVAHNYQMALRMFENNMRIIVVDGNKSREDVFGEIVKQFNF